VKSSYYPHLIERDRKKRKCKGGKKASAEEKKKESRKVWEKDSWEWGKESGEYDSMGKGVKIKGEFRSISRNSVGFQRNYDQFRPFFIPTE
jgi:hypothetical protein